MLLFLIPPLSTPSSPISFDGFSFIAFFLRSFSYVPVTLSSVERPTLDIRHG